MSKGGVALRRPRLGAVLCAGYAFVAGTWFFSARPEEGLWLSHLSLLLAGLGFALGSAALLAGTLVGIFVFHSLWCFDALAWLATGRFPMGITYYLEHATPAQWLATLHHFFLFPLLAVVLLGARAFRFAAWPTACAAFAIAVLVSRALTPEAANVNGAFGPPPGIEGSFLDPVLTFVTEGTSGLGVWAWPLVMIGFCSFVNFLPVTLLFRLLQAALPAVQRRGTALLQDSAR